MNISLYNTLSRQKELFVPINKDQVGLYSCGPTVYLYPHIGNMRPYVISDLIRRLFEYEGQTVTQVINITDVGHLVSDTDEGEDKMEKEARIEGKSAKEIADFYLADFRHNLANLNIRSDGTIFPRATEHIKEQIELIKTLEEKGFTYRTSDGIYFDTAKYPKYAELAKLDLAGQREGARVEVNHEKRNPTDFALWKFSPKGELRQQEWESPWGKGFPGWHIECSAMSMKYLGHHFDIHTGGIDHIPVHHTNERAQSECATGEPYANYWLHVAFLIIEGEKMSKSLGNIYRIADLEEKGYSPLAYRYWLLTGSYHKTLNFTWETLNGAQTAYDRLLGQISELRNLGGESGTPDSAWRDKFSEAISDDLNSPQAIAVIWDLLKDDSVSPADKLATILDFDRVLGLDLKAQSKKEIVIPETVKQLALEREDARRAKNYSKSDELRQ
ncbi:MAG: cysteine--tRNA ligase, partial [Candidatus Vogelbacteria bacterium]|nr:cysteine--tRNA ligase [Candidatus Vogelbacteria bacterium]